MLFTRTIRKGTRSFMKENDVDEIRNLAQKFRQGIEEYIHKSKPNNWLLNSFPKGNCSLASELLQRFLCENEIHADLVYASAGYGEKGESHVWLMTDDDIVIDITGDQYKQNNNGFKYEIPVYVGVMDSFHNLFTINGRYQYPELDSAYSNSISANKNNKDYENIKEHISESE